MRLLSALALLMLPALLPAQSVTGVWRVTSDSSSVPGLSMHLVEAGDLGAVGLLVRGFWTAPRVGCEPANTPSCMSRGDVLGYRSGKEVTLELRPDSPTGVRASAPLTMTSATTMVGPLSMAFDNVSLAVKSVLTKVP